MKIESFYNKKEKKQQYRARFQINRKEFYLTADTKKELNELIDEIRVQERREKRGVSLPDSSLKSAPTVKELFDKTLAGIENNRHRLRFFERIFEGFLKLIPPEMKITDLKKTHFSAYYNWRRPQKGKQSKKPVKLDSIYKELYGIRGVFSKADHYFAELEGWSPPSLPQISDKIKSRTDSRRTRIVSKDGELELLLKKLREPRAWRQTEAHHYHRIRLAHNLEFRYETGLRRKEVARLEKKNFHEKENALRDVVRWKTGTVTPYFPLTRRAQEIIKERLEIQQTGKFIFTPDGNPIESDYRTLREVCRDLGIAYGRFYENGFVPHDLRHNFASEIIENTDIETARELLGHNNIQQTSNYLHTNESRLRDAMRRREGFELVGELVVIYKGVRRGKIKARKFIEMIKKLL